MTTPVAAARPAPAPAPAPAQRLSRYDGEGSTSPVDRYVWHPVAAPPPAGPRRPVSGRQVVVLGGSASARQDTLAVLRERGARVAELPPPGEGEDVDTVAARAAESVRSTGRVDLVVDLGVAPPFAPQDHGRWRRALAQTVAVLQAVYDDWAAETDATRCGYLAVTALGGRMGYDLRDVAQPLGGLWAGFAKSLPHELPVCRVKVLDLGGTDYARPGELVAVELESADLFEVGWRDGVRATLGCRREPVGTPRLWLGPGVTVLVSGGGRGVGFELARALARGGCRVVVTGRQPAPAPDDPLLAGLDDVAFHRLQRERLRAAAGRDLARARRENARLAAAREVARNLAGARAEGLDVAYRVCDVVDRDAVARLVRELGPDLRVVVHNAGIAAPVRLPRKSVTTVLDVVACKLEGFVALADALADRDVDLVCNVGSAAGRLGGMPGQIDYAAANEVLSRLGFWARGARGLPVTTLAWTTWNRLGLIGNFDAALRYGAAVDVEDGIARWTAELAAAQPGEAMVLGRVGTALAPTQLAGFLEFSDSPDLPRLRTLHHFLGEVEEYAPFTRISTRSHLRPGAPLDREVRLDGQPILPVSVALEYAVSVGEWVAPEGWPPRRLAEVRDARVDLAALRLGPDGLELVKEGRGARLDGEWTVAVRLTTADGREAVTATLVYGDSADPPPDGPAPAARPEPLPRRPLPRNPHLQWSGVALPRPAVAGSGRPRLVVPAWSPADFWPTPHPPEHALPSAAVEAVVAAVAAEPGAAGAPSGLRIARLRLHRPAPGVTAVGSGGTWEVLDGGDRPVVTVTGLELV